MRKDELPAFRLDEGDEQPEHPRYPLYLMKRVSIGADRFAMASVALVDSKESGAELLAALQAQEDLEHLVVGCLKELPKSSATRMFAERLAVERRKKP